MSPKAQKKVDPAVARLQKRVKALEEQLEKVVAVISNRLNFDINAEVVDIPFTGESGQSESQTAEVAEAAAE